MKLYAFAIGFAVMVGSAATAPRPNDVDARAFEAAIADLDVGRAFTTFGPCIDCVYCGGGEETHKLLNSAGGYDTAHEGPHFDDCWSTGFCSMMHFIDINCSGFDSLTAEESSALWLAATSGDPNQLTEALVRYPTAVRLNTDRSALQLYGCRGDLVANIPLTPAQLADLL